MAPDRTGDGQTGSLGFGATGQELPSIPLKVVVFSELAPRELGTGRPAELGKRLRIDRESFDDVLGRLGLRATIDVEDRLAGSPKPLILEFPLESLKSFRPESLLERLPAARDLLRARDAVAGLKEGKSRIGDVRALLDGLGARSAALDGIRAALAGSESSPPAAVPAPVQAPSGLDALLESVDAPESGPAGRGADLARLDAFVRRIVAGGTVDRIDARAVEAALGEIDAALSAQADAILHHPEMRRLEAAWRGLRLLVERIDFRTPLRLEIVPCGKPSLVKTFDDLVLGPESADVSDEPVGFVVVDHEFSRSPEDLDLLRALSERGAALSAPVIAAAGPGLLGLESAGEVARRKGLREVLDGPDAAKWKGLRETGPSRWLAVAFNRFLLRPTYAPGEWAARSFGYVEGVPGGRDSERLWGSPVFAVAALACRSFSRVGWATDMMGQRAAGTIDDLHVRAYDRPGGEPVPFPLETSVSDEAERDLTDRGIMALTAPLGTDRAYLRFAPTVHAPQHYQDPTDRARAKLQSTLPFQMFVGRLVNAAMLLEGILVPGRGAEEIAAGFDRALRGLLGSAGPVAPDAVRVAVVPSAEDPSTLDLDMKVRWPGGQSLPGAGDVELRWPLRA